jgi:hypothetical protein
MMFMSFCVRVDIRGMRNQFNTSKIKIG